MTCQGINHIYVSIWSLIQTRNHEIRLFLKCVYITVNTGKEVYEMSLLQVRHFAFSYPANVRYIVYMSHIENHGPVQ